MGAAAVVTVSMVPGYRSSSVRFSKDEGQAERALVRAGSSASSTGLNRSTAASIPAVGGAGVVGMSEVLDAVDG
jgi:hypothetical protein